MYSLRWSGSANFTDCPAPFSKGSLQPTSAVAKIIDEGHHRERNGESGVRLYLQMEDGVLKEIAQLDQSLKMGMIRDVCAITAEKVQRK